MVTQVKDDHSDESPKTSHFGDAAIEKNEYIAYHGLPPDPDAHLSEAERLAIDKKLVRKLDLKLIPWLSLLYLMSFLDRKQKQTIAMSNDGESHFANSSKLFRNEYWKCKNRWS